MRALLFLNPTAHRGTARERLERVEDRLRAFEPETLESTGDELRDIRGIEQAIEAGYELLIAAGGDGTVHQLANALWTIHSGERPDGVVLGAVGLGSSNDFHKPTDREVPCRLNIDEVSPRDVVLARFDGGADKRERVFVASASMGVTADANEAFNREDAVLSILKKNAIALAIPWAALKTIVSFENFPAELDIGGERRTVELSNLSLLKTPFVSGSLRFDVDVSESDGTLAVTLCENMSRAELVATLASLYRGRFQGRPKTRVWQTGAPLQVQLREPKALELDGEVYAAERARFEIQPGWLPTCGI